MNAYALPLMLLPVLLTPVMPLGADEQIKEPLVSLASVSPSSTVDKAGMTLRSAKGAHPLLEWQVKFLDNLLRFSKPVVVRTDVDEGPLYDPETQEIWMPDSFADLIESYFEDESAVADVYFHTLMHEVGHVFFEQYQLPLLSREEDAADALASVLLLEYVENGDEVALNAAEMFGLESDSYEWFEQSDFWGEHSLDIQRYYTTLCHVYGHDPEEHAELVNDEYGLSEERASGCEQEYERIRQGWLGILEPYLKR